jgi:hypothetical protein
LDWNLALEQTQVSISKTGITATLYDHLLIPAFSLVHHNFDLLTFPEEYFILNHVRYKQDTKFDF